MPDFRLFPPHGPEPDHGEHVMFAGGRREHHVGESESVLDAFLGGQPGRTRAAKVPGGYRLRSEPSTDEPGAHDLFSYRTRIARRHAEGDVSVSPRRYSPTTTKWQNKLIGKVHQTHEPSGETRRVSAAVPGRWGGFGIPWHATGIEDLPFIHFRRKA